MMIGLTTPHLDVYIMKYDSIIYYNVAADERFKEYEISLNKYC